MEKKIKCETCPKIFSITPAAGRGKRYIFCSHRCLTKWLAQKKKKAKSRVSKRPDLENQFFRSSWEANYARTLNHLGVKWQYEPKTFVFTNITKGAISYQPDFYLPEIDKWVEVKGHLTSKDRTKIKRFRDQYPEEFAKLTFVANKKALEWFAKVAPDAQATKYDELVKKYSHLPNWERPSKKSSPAS